MAGVTIRCLTCLATPQKNWLREKELNLPVLAYETSEPPLLYSRVKVLEAMKGVEPLSTGLQDRRSGIQLSYIATNKFQVTSSRFQVRESGSSVGTLPSES